MRFLSVSFRMWQAQRKDSERRKRRKEELPVCSCPWAYSEELYDCHRIDGELSGMRELKLALVWSAFFII